MANQREFYDCMFKAAWATIDAFAAEKGLLTGMTSILHTWGSNLFYHPHIHCIVPGGGIDARGVWHKIHGCRGTPFLFPVAAMSHRFRGRFMNLLTRRLKDKGVAIPQTVRKKCFDQPWVIHAKPPAKGVGQVLEYIGRYAYRVAITNSRILDVADGRISYDYKIYKKSGKHGVMSMDIDAFLNLLSLHILPDHFVRIRHYGILSPCNRNKMRSIQQQLYVPPVPKERKKKSYLDICNEKGWNIGFCEECSCQRLIMRTIYAKVRAKTLACIS
ncbi:MAG: transposase [Prevotella sp.]|nr:transposase [Prevotella sp.]